MPRLSYYLFFILVMVPISLKAQDITSDHSVENRVHFCSDGIHLVTIKNQRFFLWNLQNASLEKEVVLDKFEIYEILGTNSNGSQVWFYGKLIAADANGDFFHQLDLNTSKIIQSSKNKKTFDNTQFKVYGVSKSNKILKSFKQEVHPGKYELVFSIHDWTIPLIDIDTKYEVMRIKGGESNKIAASFAASVGKALLYNSKENKSFIIDLDKKEIASAVSNKNLYRGPFISDNGKQLGFIVPSQIHAVNNGKLTKIVENNTWNNMKSAAFISGTDSVLFKRDNHIVICNASTLEKLSEYKWEGFKYGIFSSNGRFLASFGENKEIVIVNSITGKPVFNLMDDGAYADKGLDMFLKNKFQECIDLYKNVNKERLITEPDWVRTYALALYHEKNYPVAIEMVGYMEASQKIKDGQVLAGLYCQTNNLEEAYNSLIKLQRSELEVPIDILLRDTALNALRNSPFWDKLILEIDRINVLYNSMNDAHTKGNFTDALKLAQEALEIQPENARLHHAYGNISCDAYQAELGNDYLKKGLEHFELEIKYSLSDYRIGLANESVAIVHEANQKYDKAAISFRKSAEANEKFFENYLASAENWLKMRNLVDIGEIKTDNNLLKAKGYNMEALRAANKYTPGNTTNPTIYIIRAKCHYSNFYDDKTFRMDEAQKGINYLTKMGKFVPEELMNLADERFGYRPPAPPPEPAPIPISERCSQCYGKGVETAHVKCTACYGNSTSPCSYCGGGGRVYTADRGVSKNCPSCWGSGLKYCYSCSGMGSQMKKQTCSKCKGTGKR